MQNGDLKPANRFWISGSKRGLEDGMMWDDVGLPPAICSGEPGLPALNEE